MNPTPGETSYPVEGLIALFKASEIWSDYRAAAEVLGCPDAEVVLRERWIRRWPIDRLFASWEDDRSRQLLFLEQKFFKIFAELGRSQQVTTKHRILTKHHQTSEHYPTPPEMFDNVGITVDRGEILMQTSKGFCVKLVEINYPALTTSTAAPSLDVDPAAPPSPQWPKSESEQIKLVNEYVQKRNTAGKRLSITAFAKNYGTTRRRAERAWEASHTLTPQHGGSRDPSKS
jgi:hypothetical protein